MILNLFLFLFLEANFSYSSSSYSCSTGKFYDVAWLRRIPTAATAGDGGRDSGRQGRPATTAIAAVAAASRVQTYGSRVCFVLVMNDAIPYRLLETVTYIHRQMVLHMT